MQFCQSLNEQALQLAEGPAESIERILGKSPADLDRGDESLDVERTDGPFNDHEPAEQQVAANSPALLGTSSEFPPFRSIDGIVADAARHIDDIATGVSANPASFQDANEVPHQCSSGGYPSGPSQDAQLAHRLGPNELVLDIAQQCENRNLTRMLDTPRMKEACRRTGILASELRVKALQEFAVIGDRPERQRLRFDHYENKRQQKLKTVLAERSRLMQESLKKDMLGTGPQYHSLQMMEQLLDQEAKRQERELRSQVRQQNTVEKENEIQLERENRLKRKQGALQEKQSKVEAMKQARTLELRAAHEQKEANQQALMLRNAQELEMRQAGYLADQLEEELRLRELRQEQERQQNGKSEQWQAKMEIIEKRNEELDAERIAHGSALVAKYESKLEEMDKKREEELMQKMLKHEESQLKLEDALDKRLQLSRQDELRRQDVAKQLESQIQRVDTFIGLREQIVEQRKIRARAASCSKEKSLNLRSLEPGPADYAARPSLLSDVGAPKICLSKPKATEGSIDSYVERGRNLPAPGAYDPKVLASGKMLAPTGGPNMNAGGKKQSFLDHQQKQAKFCPGPGAYDNRRSLELAHVAAIRRDYVRAPDGRASAFVPDSCTPGPAAYALDAHQRQRRMNAQRSLPSLQKALNLC